MVRLRDWKIRGWKKHTNPSGEVILTKTFTRILMNFANHSDEDIIKKRTELADILQVPPYDLLGRLEITVKIDRYPLDDKRFNKYDTYGL